SLEPTRIALGHRPTRRLDICRHLTQFSRKLTGRDASEACRRPMRAVAVFPESRSIKVIDDHPEPKLEHDTEVLLRMMDIGICGTDREICRFDYGTPPADSPYLVIGHESLGQVVRTGSGVTRIKPGDFVVTMVRRPCPHPDCRSCRA